MILFIVGDAQRGTDITRLLDAAGLGCNDYQQHDPRDTQIALPVMVNSADFYDEAELPRPPRWTWRELLMMWRRGARGRQASAVSLTKRPFRQVGSERLKRRRPGGVFCWARRLRAFA